MWLKEEEQRRDWRMLLCVFGGVGSAVGQG